MARAPVCGKSAVRTYGGCGCVPLYGAKGHFPQTVARPSRAAAACRFAERWNCNDSGVRPRALVRGFGEFASTVAHRRAPVCANRGVRTYGGMDSRPRASNGPVPRMGVRRTRDGARLCVFHKPPTANNSQQQPMPANDGETNGRIRRRYRERQRKAICAPTCCKSASHIMACNVRSHAAGRGIAAMGA